MTTGSFRVPAVRGIMKTGLLLAASLFLVACASGPKKEGLDVSIQASTDVNPDSQGRPSPIVVHVFELTSVETFNSLDYVSLTNNSGAALGADRLNGSQVVVSPGGSNMMALEVDPAATAIGVVAGYRDLDNASWRSAVTIAPGRTDTILVQLGQFQMTTSTEN